ncbi:alpha/beta hydrolase [Paenibacillus sp. P26]|nr:alpha/beta hydrolase [Paenibacillus sp. P26]
MAFTAEGGTERAGEKNGEHIRRHDYRLPSEPGIELFVREVRPSREKNSPPLLLLHGARVPGIPSFDLQVPGGSLAETLAREGFTVYIADIRGYGYSTRPLEMSEPSNANPPLVRSAEAVKDIAAVVDWIREKNKGRKAALLGWATGGLWAGHYTTLYPEKVSALMLYNTIYGGGSNHPSLGAGSPLEDPGRPGTFHESAFGSYRLNTAESLFPSWDNSIPSEDKSEWRDPQVAEAYAAESLRSDATSGGRTPASFRAPSGAMEDTFYSASGRQLWDASLIRVPTLVLQSEYDFWSRGEDRRRLVKHLVHAPFVREALIEGATHYVHLDRPEKGRDRFVREVVQMLELSGGA